MQRACMGTGFVFFHRRQRKTKFSVKRKYKKIVVYATTKSGVQWHIELFIKWEKEIAVFKIYAGHYLVESSRFDNILFQFSVSIINERIERMKRHGLPNRQTRDMGHS